MTDELAWPDNGWPGRPSREAAQAAARAQSAAGLAAARPRVPPAPSWLALAALLAGLVGAVALAEDAPPGLGLALTTTAIAAALVPAARPRLTWWSGSAGAVAVLLAGMSVVRDAEWLVALDLLAAFALGSIALAGGGSFRELIRGSASVLIAGPMAPAHLGKTLVARAATRPTRRVGPAIRAIIISTVVLVVFGALFSSADAVFGDLADRLVPSFELDVAPFRFVVFLTVALLVGAGGLVAARVSPVGLSRGLSSVADALLAPLDPRRVRTRPQRIEWMAPLVVLNALFAAFVAVQLAVLFGGREHLLETPGLTAAEYARSGFFQLLTVCLLTLGVIALAVRWVDPGERLRLRLLLGSLCTLTAVVLVSAARRLHHYEEAFGYTRLRLFVNASMVVIGGILVLLLVAGAFWRAAWLPRAIVSVAVLALVALNVMNADAFVASRNIDRAGAGMPIDTYYLSGLSADAADELLALPEPARSCVFRGLRERLDRLDDAGWRGANLSRSRARESIDEHGLGYGLACPAVGAS